MNSDEWLQRLKYKPQVESDGKLLTCSVQHKGDESATSDQIKLHVMSFVPNKEKCKIFCTLHLISVNI